MNVIKYNVNSGDVCQIGRQYEYGKTQVIFEGYQVNDSANEIYFKFVGRTEDSKYLIPIIDMTLDITQQLTKHVGQFSCQLEEMNTEGTLVSQSPVFYVAVKRSIKVGADYEVQDPRLETIYQKYNAMYNTINDTNNTVLANESQRQAEWITLKQEVADAVASIDGKLDWYKASTTDTLRTRLNGFIGEAEKSIQTALETYETQTDSNINDKLTAYQSKTTSDINRMFDDSDRTSKEKIDKYISEIEQRRIAGEFNGSDGYTPVKGKDYFTESEIVQFKKDVTPKKRIDYFTDSEISQIQNEVSSGAIGEFRVVVQTETDNFNTNAANKVSEFDVHTEQIQADISELKSDLIDIGYILGTDPKSIELTEHAGVVDSGFCVGTSNDGYKVFTFPMIKGKKYIIKANNNNVLRFGASSFEFTTGIWLNDGVTSPDLSRLEYLNTKYNYGYIFGVTVSNPNAHFSVFEVNAESRLDGVESEISKLYDGYDYTNIDFEEHESAYINSEGYLSKSYPNYSVISFPVSVGDKYLIRAVDNEVLRIASGRDIFENVTWLGNVVTSENKSECVYEVSNINAVRVFVTCKTPNYPNASITVLRMSYKNGRIDSLDSKVLAINNIIGIEIQDYASRGDCKSNGKLFKSGTDIVNSDGTIVELRGVGTHHLLQYNNLHTWEFFNSVKNMGVNMIRCTAYLHDRTYEQSDSEPTYGYISHPEETKAEIEKIVKICIDLGLYVIIDWHNLDDYANDYKQEAIEFFDYYSRKYSTCPNVFYEILNEPYLDDSSTIASFVNDVRNVIVSNTENPIMLVGQPAPLVNSDGTKNWSIYDRCLALYNAMTAIGITDVFVSPHNYGGSAVTEYQKCIDANIPIFVSEWGNSDSDGHGSYHDSDALKQIIFLHENAIPQSLWKLTDQDMTSSLIKNQGVINSYRYSRGFSQNELSHNGVLLLGKFKDFVTTEWIDRNSQSN